MDTNNNANVSASIAASNNNPTMQPASIKDPRFNDSQKDATESMTEEQQQQNSSQTETTITFQPNQNKHQQTSQTQQQASDPDQKDQKDQIELHAEYDASDNVLNNGLSPQKDDDAPIIKKEKLVNNDQQHQCSDNEQNDVSVSHQDPSNNDKETKREKPNIICVKESEADGSEPIEIELESDGSLLLTSLTSLYPEATGLKYRHPASNTLRGVKLTNGRFLEPIDGWKAVSSYLCVFSRGSKRKNDSESGARPGKQAKNDQQDSNNGSDLVVLGLPWTTTEASMKSYFEQYGEVVMVQVKTDPKTGKSRGFGFVRFAKSNAQSKLLSMRHLIDGRWCDVRVPLSKAEADATKAAQLSRKIFVGRLPENITTDNLRDHFSSFGTLTDVFIPKPFRNFAFVTFGTSDMAQSLFKHKHVINGATVQISEAIPRDNPPNNHGYSNTQQTNNSNNYGASYGNVNTNNIHPFNNSYTHQAPVSHYHSAKVPASNMYPGGWKQQQQQQHPQPSYYPMPSYSTAGQIPGSGAAGGYSQQPNPALNGGQQYFKMPQHQMMPQTHLGHNSTYPPQLSSSSSVAASSSSQSSYSAHGANNFSRNSYSSVWK